jgi:hypothetical protein
MQRLCVYHSEIILDMGWTDGIVAAPRMVPTVYSCQMTLHFPLLFPLMPLFSGTNNDRRKQWEDNFFVRKLGHTLIYIYTLLM